MDDDKKMDDKTPIPHEFAGASTPIPTEFSAPETSEKVEKKSKLQVTTVAEAKEQIASLKDDDSLVWGTRVWKGTKKDFALQLQNMPDGDAIVWGN